MEYVFYGLIVLMLILGLRATFTRKSKKTDVIHDKDDNDDNDKGYQEIINITQDIEQIKNLQNRMLEKMEVIEKDLKLHRLIIPEVNNNKNEIYLTIRTEKDELQKEDLQNDLLNVLQIEDFRRVSVPRTKNTGNPATKRRSSS